MTRWIPRGLAVAVLAAAVPMSSADAREPLSKAEAFQRAFDAWIPSALEAVEVVPALSLAVVVDDEVVLARAYGVADHDTRQPVDADTRFYIASSTKSYLGLLAALLDEEGTLPLGSTLDGHVPRGGLPDAVRPDEVRVRDLLSHTSGISNGPIAYRLAYTGVHDRDTLWRLLAESQVREDAPLGAFRYTNVGYNIYGMLLERATGTSWQEHLRERIFEPAGLERTSAYVSAGDRRGFAKAAPHFGLHPGGIQRLPLEKQDNTMQSAGGMMTTARDAARWLLLQLNEGTLDGRAVLSPEAIRRSHAALTAAPDNPRTPFGQSAYGLGWSHGSYDGRLVLSHGGGFAGFRSILSFMPEEKIGVAVMVNEGSVGGHLLRLAAHAAYDWWLGNGVEGRDAGLASIAEQVAPLRDRIHADFENRAGRTWKLSRAPESYVGTYENPLWGTIEITRENGEYHVRSGNLACVATPYTEPETMRVELIPVSGRAIVFQPEHGPVERIQYDDETFERAQPEG